jgi:hypothetical protein
MQQPLVERPYRANQTAITTAFGSKPYGANQTAITTAMHLVERPYRASQTAITTAMHLVERPYRTDQTANCNSLWFETVRGESNSYHNSYALIGLFLFIRRDSSSF